jgi:hypothetical protein
MKMILAIAAVIVASCAAPPAPVLITPAGQRDLDVLASFVSGTFETIAQPAGEGDSTAVTMRNAVIWPELRGERWIYSEYQRAGEAQPFRQRVYRFREAKGGLIGDVYELPAPATRFAGAGRAERPLAELSPGGLVARPGCELLAERQGDHLFNIGTIADTCQAAGGGFERPDFYITSSSIRHWIARYDAPSHLLPGQPGPWEFRKKDEKFR